MTLILTRGDVVALLTLDACIAAVEQAFALQGESRALGPGILGLHVPDGGFHVKAAGLPLSRLYVAVKVNANFPENGRRRGLPTIQGVLALSDGESGRPLALMDSMEITVLRTGAATAVAARHLARPDARTATIVGCGRQGRIQLAALARVRPLERAYAVDTDAAVARRFATETSAQLGLDVRPARSAAEAAPLSDICVTCTPSRHPLLRREDIAAGAFVAAVGADSEDKVEIDPALMAAGTVVVDNLEQCATIGDLHHALACGVLATADVHATLADVVAGRRPGRTSAEEITIFDSTGVAIEDVAAAVAVYEGALVRGRGVTIDLAG
ncbi:MAG TPA: ornithine cyclodeaminase family protein [Methylomirabilota bacterium]|nr:ornithine cyclodeaminase family protein [Methylomirabilota bacterium]